MTLITGTIKDSGNNPLNGRLVITANNIISSGSNLILQEPSIYTVTNGVVNVELASTDISNISYKFSVQVLRPTNENDEWFEIYSFNSTVPNVTSVDFTSLIATDYTPDQLDTGKFAIARILATNETYAASLRFRPSYRGEYKSNVIYKIDDIVVNNGSSFIYINPAQSFNNAPPVLPNTFNSYWSMVALGGLGIKGDTGAKGDKGNPGVNGQNNNDHFFSAAVDQTVTITTGSTTYHLVKFDKVLFNNSGAYDHTTGLFTAPEQGFYQFNGNVDMVSHDLNSKFDTVRCQLVVTNSGNTVKNTYRFASYENLDHSEFAQGFTTVVNMAAGDKASIQVLTSKLDSSDAFDKYMDKAGTNNYKSYFNGYSIHKF